MSKCIPIKNGILCLADTLYQCPYCGEIHDDSSEVILNRINKNKSGNTKVKCAKCGKKFYMTYNIRGDFQTWK